MANLLAVIKHDIGTRVSDAHLRSLYRHIQCQGYQDDVLSRAYGIKTRAWILPDGITTDTPAHLQQVARLSGGPTADQVEDFFESLSYGDALQMVVAPTRHSAMYVGSDATGAWWLDANWNFDNVVRVHHLTWQTIAADLTGQWWYGIAGYHVV